MAPKRLRRVQVIDDVLLYACDTPSQVLVIPRSPWLVAPLVLIFSWTMASSPTLAGIIPTARELEEGPACTVSDDLAQNNPKTSYPHAHGCLRTLTICHS